MLIAIHMSPQAPSFLPEILSRRGTLPASAPFPNRGEPLEARRLYVVRPDHHLVVEKNIVRSMRGPRVNGHRPALDVLFRSAAIARSDRVIAVVLTGMLDDGVGGVREVRLHGGLAIVQSPEDAQYPDLPRNAILGAGADYVVPISEMGGLLVRLLKNSAPGGGSTPPTKKGESSAEGGVMPSRTTGPAQDWSSPKESPEGGAPSVFSCPECHGVLWNTGPDDLPRFVCRVGHAYNPESLLAEQMTQSEQQMWAALRAVEEGLSLARKLETRARALGQTDAERRLAEHVSEAEREAAILRSVLDPSGASTQDPAAKTEPPRGAP